jgi:DNA modification methylase
LDFLENLKRIKIADYAPHPKNPNGHPLEQLAELDDSLGRFGQFKNVVVWRDYFLAGHGLVEAARRRGISELVAVDMSHLSETDALALMVADNQLAELSVMDDKLLADLLAVFPEPMDVPGITEDWLDEFGDLWLGEEPPAEGEDTEPKIELAEVLRGEWGVEPGQLWELGQHRLICGDCTDPAVVKRVMGGEQAEMCFTDPPYGVAIGDKNKMLNSIVDPITGKTRSHHKRVQKNLVNDDISERELAELVKAAFDEVLNVLSPGGAWYVCVPGGPLMMIFGEALKLRGVWRQTITWVKNQSTFSPMGVDYHWQSEPIIYGWSPGAGHRYYGGRKQTTVWEIAKPMASPEHPTMKPVDLVERAIQNSTKVDELVYDPFLGSGTTLVACENLKRQCRAVEIDPGYVAVAIQRWATHTDGEPKLLEAA